MRVELKVKGMKCAKCVDTIEKCVGEIEGISFIDVDLESGVVGVEFEAPASEAMIREAILDSGFEC